MELDPRVMAQLTDYVTTIASMYHDHPFHNFAHCTQVAMATQKFLKRVILTELEEDDDDINFTSYGFHTSTQTQFALIFCALIHDVGEYSTSLLLL